jgi:hypothetical protein
MKNSICLCTLVIVLLTACGPDKSYVDDGEIHTSLTDFYSSNRTTVQTFSVSSSSGGVATTSHGAIIHLPANGFVTSEGTPVTGNVDISVKEIVTPAEMILNNMPTMSGGLPLESGGEFHITVTKGNQRLKLAPGNLLRIEIPDRSNVSMSNMQVFNGKANSRGEVDWTANNNPGNFVVRDSMMFAKSSLFCDSIEWINCDKFINEPTVRFDVYPGNAPSNDSTNVFVHLTGRNTIVKMNWTQGLSYFTSDKVLPVQSTIIGISIKNGKLSAALQPVMVTNNQSITLNFVAMTEEQLKQRLAQLH